MKTLLKFFPFPKYLQIPGVGIDISDRSIKYIELVKKEKGLCVKQFGRNVLDSGIIENGEIKNKGKLVEALKHFQHDLGNKYIIASLPEEKAFLKVVSLPELEISKLKSTLELQIEEIVPFSVEDVIFDYEVLSSGKGKMDIALGVISRQVAEDYAGAFKEAGFVPLAFELENQSVYRALVDRESKETVMIIDFGKTRTSFVVGRGNVVRFSSTIKISGSDIDAALAKKMKVDVFEAERFKLSQSLHKNADPEFLAVALPFVSAIKDEMKRILDFWRSHNGENAAVGKIILCGGDANIKGTDEFFSYNIDEKVEVGNVWVNVADIEDYLPVIEKKESLMYTTALGLALRQFV